MQSFAFVAWVASIASVGMSGIVHRLSEGESETVTKITDDVAVEARIQEKVNMLFRWFHDSSPNGKVIV